MNINEESVTCTICKNVFTQVVTHKKCGYPFDLQCIRKLDICPRITCNEAVCGDDFNVNYGLQTVVDNYRMMLRTSYHLYLLDTSSSMRWSDHVLFGLVGASRFKQAVHFLIKVFEKQKTWPQHQVSLVTFDNDPKIIVPFSTVSGVHEEKLKLLRPVGKETALFDAINSCLDTFKNLNEINGGHISPQNLYILSDGKRTAGATASNSEIDTSFLNDHTKRLKIIAHIIHIGNTNIPETRDLCEQLGYNYINVYGDNASENANSFLSSIAMRAKAVLATPCVTLTSGAVEKALKRWQEMETTIESLFSAHDGEIDIQRSETEPSPRNRQSNDRRIAIGNEQM